MRGGPAVIWALVLVPGLCLGEGPQGPQGPERPEPLGLTGHLQLTNYRQGEGLGWDLSLPSGHSLRLTLHHIEGDPSAQCRLNHVELFADREHLGRFCGNVTVVRLHRPAAAARPVVSLLARCRSADPHHRRGFSVFYEAVDVDECARQWEGRCHHFCHNHIGGFRCFCRHGYSLHSDGRTCKVTDCGDPGDLVNGDYSLVKGAAGTGIGAAGTGIGAAVTYRCPGRYYRLAAGSDGLYTCLINGKWTNDVVGEDVPHCDAVCGQSQWPLLGPQRVLGGGRAQPGSFPWHVYMEDSVCGGALVSTLWVLTSASCVSGLSAVRMLTGGTDRNDPALWQRLEAVDIHIHPDYGRSALAHDLALVRLKQEALLGEMVSPVCLPRAHPQYQVERGSLGYVSGFGETEHLAQSDRLMFAPVPVADLAECRDVSPPGTGLPLLGEVFCAGGAGADACTGDGGGSLVFRDPLDMSSVYTAGVVSWGSDCGHFGLYTSVQHHLDWINTVMETQSPPVHEG